MVFYQQSEDIYGGPHNFKGLFEETGYSKTIHLPMPMCSCCVTQLWQHSMTPCVTMTNRCRPLLLCLSIEMRYFLDSSNIEEI